MNHIQQNANEIKHTNMGNEGDTMEPSQRDRLAAVHGEDLSQWMSCQPVAGDLAKSSMVVWTSTMGTSTVGENRVRGEYEGLLDLNPA